MIRIVAHLLEFGFNFDDEGQDEEAVQQHESDDINRVDFVDHTGQDRRHDAEKSRENMDEDESGRRDGINGAGHMQRKSIHVVRIFNLRETFFLPGPHQVCFARFLDIHFRHLGKGFQNVRQVFLQKVADENQTNADEHLPDPILLLGNNDICHLGRRRCKDEGHNRKNQL